MGGADTVSIKRRVIAEGVKLILSNVQQQKKKKKKESFLGDADVAGIRCVRYPFSSLPPVKHLASSRI